MPSSAISFIIPAYNCSEFLRETVASIVEGNLSPEDEIVIVDDASTDETSDLISSLQSQHSVLRAFKHEQNRGGGAARNTAVSKATNDLVFCLDSDNILVPNSIAKLKRYFEESKADVAAFQELHYFNKDIQRPTHKWTFRSGLISFADALSGIYFPGASGNYLFTKQSWTAAGAYPEDVHALDAWGFGIRQVATNQRMFVMPNSFYLHRYGHDSYFMRDHREGNIPRFALKILAPFEDQIDKNDYKEITSSRADTWFYEVGASPVRLRNGDIGKTGSESRI